METSITNHTCQNGVNGMRHRILWLALMMVMLSGCRAAPQTPDAAVPVARAFMDAWVARDSSAIQGLLTEKARQAVGWNQITNHLRVRRIGYEGLGAPGRRGDAWVQVPVRNLTVRFEQSEVRWPEVRLTLHHDGRQWQVAWAEPLLEEAMLAYERGAYSEQLVIGRTIAEIDPYQYRGYLEQHFASRGLKRYREAELLLVRAQEAASPAQLPDVYDATARFKLSLGDASAAALRAKQALESAAPLIPSTYSKRWQADTLVVLGQALLKAGDRAGAEGAVRQAADADPENAPLAVFRKQMSAGTQPLPPTPSKS